MKSKNKVRIGSVIHLDNENNLESIVLKTQKGDLYEFTNDDIETIEIT